MFQHLVRTLLELTGDTHDVIVVVSVKYAFVSIWIMCHFVWLIVVSIYQFRSTFEGPQSKKEHDPFDCVYFVWQTLQSVRGIMQLACHIINDFIRTQDIINGSSNYLMFVLVFLNFDNVTLSTRLCVSLVNTLSLNIHKTSEFCKFLTTRDNEFEPSYHQK